MGFAPLPVSRWACDAAIGQISARDARGNLIMAINTGPSFAARLVSAFSGLAPTEYSGAGPRPPAFPP